MAILGGALSHVADGTSIACRGYGELEDDVTQDQVGFCHGWDGVHSIDLLDVQPLLCRLLVPELVRASFMTWLSSIKDLYIIALHPLATADWTFQRNCFHWSTIYTLLHSTF